jgi:AcrR family transcriptional regulator
MADRKAAAAPSARKRQPRPRGQQRSGKIAAPRRRPTPARREAILAAALDEFSARGFSAARLDDVARRAGVAKGTIYLYFRDKDALFEELIRSVLSPVVGALELALKDQRPVREIAEAAVEIFVREVYGTRRKDVVRLVITEGARFPKLAEFYHREVLSRLFLAVQALLKRAADSGELRNAAVVKFPQLIGAPAIVGIIWNSLFEKFEPLDVRGFLHAQLDLIFTEARRP